MRDKETERGKEREGEKEKERGRRERGSVCGRERVCVNWDEFTGFCEPCLGEGIVDFGSRTKLSVFE